jgi:hypothetical protein
MGSCTVSRHMMLLFTNATKMHFAFDMHNRMERGILVFCLTILVKRVNALLDGNALKQMTVLSVT